MLTYLIGIAALFYIQQSVSSAPAAENQTGGGLSMCLTHAQNQSSPEMRTWAFQILQRAGYPTPHDVVIINAPSTPSSSEKYSHHACAYATRKVIHFNEHHFAGHPIGVKLAIISHEAVHLHQNDDPAKFKEPQKHERYADTQGLLLGDCEKCGIEIAQYYADAQHKETKNIPEAFSHPAMPKSIKEFKAATKEKQGEFLELAQKVSEKKYTTHPCGLERAFYLYALSQSSALKGKRCQFHQRHSKRKIIVRQISSPQMQHQESVSGTKRSRDDEHNTTQMPPTKK